MAGGGTVVTLLLGLVMEDPGATRAESLLAARDLPAARRAAEQLVRERPCDAGAHLLLGRVWLSWPTVGRYDALTQFRTAARLAPGDPEPLYRQAEAGFRLGSDARSRRWASGSRGAPTRSPRDRKSTRLNSSHLVISYAVFCLKKKKTNQHEHDN